jgi:hypothetical protein
MTLQQLFYNYNNELLKQFVKLCGGPGKLTRKDELVNFLTGEFLNPTRLRVQWARLDGISQKAVAAAYHNDGTFDADAFAAQYDALPERPRSAWSYYSQPILLDLFIHQNQIPAELMPLLADLVPPPERFQVSGVVDAPTTIIAFGKNVALIQVETEEAGLHDLAVALRLAEQGKLKFASTSSRLTPGSAKTLLESLLLGDFLPQPEGVAAKETIRPFGLDVFVQGAGLVRAGYSSSGLTAAGKAYLKTEDPELLLEAFEQWANESSFDEITRLTELKGFRTRGLRLSKPATRRAAIVEALSWCPTGVWISIKEFYRALRVWHLAIPIEEAGHGSLYFGERYPYEPWTDSRSYWLLTQGLYTNAVLWEYLATIGALDLLYVSPGEIELAAETYYHDDDVIFSRYDGLAYFRINPLGAYLFGQAEAYERITVERGPLFRLDDDLRLEICDSQALTPNLLRQLETVTRRIDDGTYQIEASRLLALFEEGSDPQSVVDFLSEHNDGTLPAAIRDLIDETHERSRAVNFGSKARLVKIRSAELMAELLKDEVIGKFANRLNDKTLVIPASKEGALRNRVRQLGYGVRE